ncbi:MAG: hypothetical protein ILA52_01480, partial [Alphaproteobacteria bacterium]|nr:hypothetical protein [Alphaproteobacteria bacterium]
LEKVDNKIGAIYKNFYDVLYATDYTLSEDIDLLNDDDYNEISKVLDEHKSIYLNMAKKQLSEINVLSTGVADKVTELKHKIAVMEKDSDEVVSISGSEDLDELEATIKRRKADRAVESEYAAAASKAAEDYRNRLRAPYCSVYLNGASLKNTSLQPLSRNSHSPLVEGILQKIGTPSVVKESIQVK